MAGRWLSSSVKDSTISVKRKEVRIIRSTFMDGSKKNREIRSAKGTWASICARVSVTGQVMGYAVARDSLRDGDRDDKV